MLEASVAGLGDSSGQAPPSSAGKEKLARAASEKVSLVDFDRIKVLGKGSFGKVVLVQRKSGSKSGERHAMKVLKKSKLRRAKQVERTKTERRVLEVCDGHPFIMSMFYAFQTEEKLYIVLEYCPGGELFFHLSRFRKFPEHVARFYAAELATAIDFLHRHGVIYRDMKVDGAQFPPPFTQSALPSGVCPANSRRARHLHVRHSPRTCFWTRRAT